MMEMLWTLIWIRADAQWKVIACGPGGSQCAKCVSQRVKPRVKPLGRPSCL